MEIQPEDRLAVNIYSLPVEIILNIFKYVPDDYDIQTLLQNVKGQSYNLDSALTFMIQCRLAAQRGDYTQFLQNKCTMDYLPSKTSLLPMVMCAHKDRAYEAKNKLIEMGAPIHILQEGFIPWEWQTLNFSPQNVIWAIQNGYLDILKFLVDHQGVQIPTPSYGRHLSLETQTLRRMLDIATYYKQKDVLLYILRTKKPTMDDLHRSLVSVCRYGSDYLDVLVLLVQHGANIIEAFQYAIHYRFPETVKVLLNYVDLQYVPSIFIKALLEKNLTILKTIYEFFYNSERLSPELRKQCLRYLVDKALDELSEQADSPSWIHITKFLVEHEANITSDVINTLVKRGEKYKLDEIIAYLKWNKNTEI